MKQILNVIFNLISNVFNCIGMSYKWLRIHPLMFASILALCVALVIWYSLNNENTRQCTDVIKNNCDIGATSPFSYYSIYIFAIPLSTYAIYLYFTAINKILKSKNDKSKGIAS